MQTTGRYKPIFGPIVPALLVTALAAPPAAAAGLDIKPPPGFTVKQTAPESGNDVTYEVADDADADAGCLVGFASATATRGLDQAAINAAAAKPGYLETAKASVSAVYTVDEVAPFTIGGAQGVALVGSPKAAKGAVRALLVLVETPKGRLSVSCVGNTDKFAGLRPGFEGVARGVSPPR